MNQKIGVVVIIMITLGITATAMVRIQSAEAIIAILSVEVKQHLLLLLARIST